VKASGSIAAMAIEMMIIGFLNFFITESKNDFWENEIM
jgi:hypothetical protein